MWGPVRRSNNKGLFTFNLDLNKIISDSLDVEICSQQRFDSYQDPPPLHLWLDDHYEKCRNRQARVQVLVLGSNDYVSFGVTIQVAQFYAFL